ncbi:MAG: ATP-binding protein, partial [Bacillota bacterium]|nr:ATP-binding protein [Bacillota bacterium]
TIKGFNELMAINNKDENLNKFTGRISKETDRLLFLIGDMLKLSELENVKNISLEDVDLRKISEEIKESLSTLSSEKNISLDIDGKGTVKAEQNHIYELLKNLLENAVKYNVENGKVKVCLKEEKNTVSITVIDTGIGIPAKDQPRIFERFYRVEKSRSRESGGTGLGLSIVKHICKIYNAELVLKSKVGEGTEIKVIFKK